MGCAESRSPDTKKEALEYQLIDIEKGLRKGIPRLLDLKGFSSLKKNSKMIRLTTESIGTIYFKS